MRDNTVMTDDGTEVYRSEIHRLADEYIKNLDTPEDIYSSNKNIFTGLIKYISSKYFKNNPVDYDDIDYLDNIWDIYTGLCYKYNKIPVIIEFCLLININRETITSWKNQNTRGYMYYTADGVRIKDFPSWKINHPNDDYKREPSHSHSNTVKKWLSECENALYRGATEGNKVGCIFALKANYGYAETAPVPTVNKVQQILGVEELPKLADMSEQPQNQQSIVQYDDIFEGDDTT